MKKFYGIILTVLTALLTSFAAQAVTFYVTIDSPDHVQIYKTVYDQDYNPTKTYYNLVAGKNTLEAEVDAYVTIEGIYPWEVSAVKDSKGDDMGAYYGSCSFSVSEGHEGAEFTVEVIDSNVANNRTASCTIWIDDASKANVTYPSYKKIPLKNGDNIIKFNPETESSVTIQSTDYSSTLYQVLLNEEPQTENWGSYYVNWTDGCTIKIFANYPDKDVTVTFEYADEASKGAIEFVSINGEADENKVADFNGETLPMKLGQTLYVRTKGSYAVDEFKYNGNNTYYAGGYYSWSQQIKDNSTVYIKAHEYQKYNVTLKVNKPEYVIVEQANNTIPTTSEGVQIEVFENSNTIYWTAATGCQIDEVTVNGEPLALSGGHDGRYSVTADCTIEIKASQMVLDKKFVLWSSAVDAVFGAFVFENSLGDNMVNGYEAGYKVFDFSNAMNPFSTSWYLSDDTVINAMGRVYNGTEEVTSLYQGSSYREFTIEDNAVIKIFIGEEPAEYSVEFTVENNPDVTVLRDIIVPVTDLATPLKVFNHTQITVAPNTVAQNDVKVTVNDQAITADEDGKFNFPVEANTRVSIVKDITLGVNGIYEGNGTKAIFNLQGVYVGESLENLPAGIYIQAGKKVVVK